MLLVNPTGIRIYITYIRSQTYILREYIIWKYIYILDGKFLHALLNVHPDTLPAQEKI